MKFKQIAVTSDVNGFDTVYALDSSGDIWFQVSPTQKKNAWHKIKLPAELAKFYDIA